MKRNLKTVITIAAALACSFCGSTFASTNVVADSVAEFSLAQGQNNWYYGSCVGGYSKNAFNLFTTTFNCCGFGDAWATSQNVWTSMWKWGGHPNGLNGNQGHDQVLHVAVRRWVSEVNGPVRITGTISNCDGPGLSCNGGSTTLQIFADGVPIFTRSSGESTYSVEVDLRLGVFVDFTIAANNDVNGGTMFTAHIEASCAVERLKNPHLDQVYDESCLDTQFAQQLVCFENAVTNLGGSISKKTSACRTKAYQDHVREIWEHYNQLSSSEGIKVQWANGYQQLETTASTAACQDVVDELNDEIFEHFKAGGVPGAVGTGDGSKHVKGKAVDWTVSLPGSVSVGDVAKGCDLWRPLLNKGETWHFELMSDMPRRKVKVTGHSPINILVRDPNGRRIGFDPSSNAVVNEIGSAAFYSGAATTPQVVEIQPEAVLFGQYMVSGVGTGNGGFTIDALISSEDDSADVYQKVLATGTATAGQPLASIPPIDVMQSTMFLSFERVGQNLILFAPPWSTNAVVQYNTNLNSGSWIDMLQPIDAGGLTLTNLSGAASFFRLRLP